MMCTFVIIINMFIFTYYYESIAISKFPVIEIPVLLLFCVLLTLLTLETTDHRHVPAV